MQAIRYAIEALWTDPLARWNWSFVARCMVPAGLQEMAACLRRRVRGLEPLAGARM